MLSFRVETVVHPASKLILAELYCPDSAGTPIARTKPIYQSHARAEADVLEAFRRQIAEQ